MADNYKARGSDAVESTFGADDISGVLHPRVKLTIGADGTAVDLDTGQELKADSLPVVLASDQGALPVTDNDGSFTVDDGGDSLTIDGTVTVVGLPPTLGQQVMADSMPIAIASDQTTLPVSMAALPVVGQQVMADSMPVTLASDQSGIIVQTGVNPLRVVNGDDFLNVTVVDDGGIKSNLDDVKTKLDALSDQITAVTGTGPYNGVPNIRVGTLNFEDFTGDMRIRKPDYSMAYWGQNAMVDSLPVVIASDQPAIPVSGTVAISGVTFPDSMSVAVTDGGPIISALHEVNTAISDFERGGGVDGAWVLRVVEATDSTLNTAVGAVGTAVVAIEAAAGATTNAAASSSVAEDATARTHTSLLKGLKNILLLVYTVLNDVYVSASHWLKVQVQASENHIGSVGACTATVTVTPTLTTHASYVSGDFVGTDATAITIAAGRVNDGTGVIQSAVLIDYALQSITTELWLFDSAPTPPNDSAAWTISDAHALKCIGVIKFDTYFANAANSVAVGSFQPIAFKCASGTQNIYGCLVTRGAPTYASGDVSIRLSILQD